MVLIIKHIDFNVVQIFGVLLLILAFFVWFVPMVEIQSNEVMLSETDNPNFETGQVSVYSGSLRWWKNLYINTVIPIIGVLVTTGLVTIIFPLFFHFEHVIFFKSFRTKYQNTTLDEYFKLKDR